MSVGVEVELPAPVRCRCGCEEVMNARHRVVLILRSTGFSLREAAELLGVSYDHVKLVARQAATGTWPAYRRGHWTASKGSAARPRKKCAFPPCGAMVPSFYRHCGDPICRSARQWGRMATWVEVDGELVTDPDREMDLDAAIARYDELTQEAADREAAAICEAAARRRERRTSAAIRAIEDRQFKRDWEAAVSEVAPVGRVSG